MNQDQGVLFDECHNDNIIEDPLNNYCIEIEDGHTYTIVNDQLNPRLTEEMYNSICKLIVARLENDVKFNANASENLWEDIAKEKRELIAELKSFFFFFL